LLAAEYLPRLPPRRTMAAVWLALALGIWGNFSILGEGASGLRDTSEVVGAELFAVELAAPDLADNYRIDPTRAPQLTAGPYLAAVADLGSPASGEATVLGSSEGAKLETDRVLLDTLHPIVEPIAPSPPAASCVRVEIGADVAAATNDGLVLVPDPGVELGIQLHRFAADPRASPVLTASADGVVHLRPDRSAVPWRARVVAGSGRLCPV